MPAPAPPALADRYGAPRPWRRPVGWALLGLLLVVSLGWLGWTAWYHSLPEVSSSQQAYDVVDDHEATATVLVQRRADEVVATCTLRAYAADHTVVGELAQRVPLPDATPAQSREKEQLLTLSVRTERRATNVELVGCTTADQGRPR